MQTFSIDSPLLELRNSSNGVNEIVGYASVFYREGDSGTEFRPVPGVVERIMPTAFDHTLDQNIDVVATYDHDSARILGRTRTNTLQLSKDERGLRFRIPFQSGDPDHELVAGKIRRGLITGASFTFALPDGGEEIRHERTETVRELHHVTLHELGPVAMPAYAGSDAAVRSANGWAASRNQDCRTKRMREVRLAHLTEILNEG